MATRPSGGWERRLRAVGVVLLFAIVALLLIHAASMPVHHDDSDCTTCVVVVAGALAGALFAIRVHPTFAVTVVHSTAVSSPVRDIITAGRHPPSRGVVMRL